MDFKKDSRSFERKRIVTRPKYGLAIPSYAANSLHERGAETYWGVYDFPLNDQTSWKLVVDTAKRAERLGFESLWTPDHFMLGKNGETFECLTTLACLSQLTEKVKLGSWVLCNNYRNPSLVAKISSTLGIVSKDRFILGYGCGWYKDEYDAFGYTFPNAPERVEMFKEGIQIIKGMFANYKFSFDGKFYKLREAISEPKPKKQVPIVVGGWGKKILQIAATYADGWDIGGDPPYDDYIRKMSFVRETLKNNNRTFDNFSTSVHMHVLIGKNETEVEDKKRKVIEVVSKLESKVRFRPSTEYRFDLEKTLIGTPEQVREKLDDYQRAGCKRFILMFVDYPRYDSIGLFASKVM
jgi:alkanesulfonate monooxygenase SsuD/methylene tetrahydromethanopterin reductase-like flavin-dependent oxidoreductase (luciferase family)